ncbi:hypothetical protein PO909_005930, partial [Leuciscus waleckii]
SVTEKQTISQNVNWLREPRNTEYTSREAAKHAHAPTLCARRSLPLQVASGQIGGNEGMRMESAVRCGCMQKRAMEIPFRVLAVVRLVLHSQALGTPALRSLAFSLSLSAGCSTQLSMTSPLPGLDCPCRVSIVRDSKPKGNIQDSYALST